MVDNALVTYKMEEDISQVLYSVKRMGLEIRALKYLFAVIAHDHMDNQDKP